MELRHADSVLLSISALAFPSSSACEFWDGALHRTAVAILVPETVCAGIDPSPYRRDTDTLPYQTKRMYRPWTRVPESLVDRH